MADRKVTAACPETFPGLVLRMVADKVRYRRSEVDTPCPCEKCSHSVCNKGKIGCKGMARHMADLGGGDVMLVIVRPGMTCDEAKPKTKRKH